MPPPGSNLASGWVWGALSLVGRCWSLSLRGSTGRPLLFRYGAGWVMVALRIVGPLACSVLGVYLCHLRPTAWSAWWWWWAVPVLLVGTPSDRHRHAPTLALTHTHTHTPHRYTCKLRATDDSITLRVGREAQVQMLLTVADIVCCCMMSTRVFLIV